MKQAVILCGGKGTRLKSLTKDTPKPLVEVSGVPLLDRTIRLLAAHGVEKVLLLAGHLSEKIIRHYSEGKAYGIEVEIFVEDTPLGTAGALTLVKDKLEEDFFIFYGDIFIDFDVSRLREAHLASEAGTVATLMIRQSDHPWDSHLVDIDPHGMVQEFIHTKEEGRLYKNWGNAAIYACNKSIVEFIPEGVASDYGKDVFPKVIKEHGKLNSCELERTGFVRDMGTPERLQIVEQYLARKSRAEAALKAPKPLKVALLDRDGTLNKEQGLIFHPSQIEMCAGAAEAVSKLTKAGWRCFLITNQPVLARGLCSVETLNEINAVVCSEVEALGGKIEKIYYSPYHPETHHGDGVLELRRASDCRKPNAGMIFQAAEENDLDLSECIMIGDTWRDILAGKKAGVRTALITEIGDAETEADYYGESLQDVVDQLLR